MDDCRDLFQETTIPLLRNYMLGQNALLFAYGKTNAGKTYTIAGSKERQGILPRTLDVIFNRYQSYQIIFDQIKWLMVD